MNKLLTSFAASLLFLLILLTSCNDRSSKNQSVLSKNDVSKVVLVGGTYIADMENHPYLEVALTKYYKDDAFSFRNIGWVADDVFGMARSQFGSAQNTQSWRPPSAEEGFGSAVLMDHIKASEPTTLFIGYGREAAFFEDEEDWDVFEKGYEELLNKIDSLSTKVILLTPPPIGIAQKSNEAVDDKNLALKRVSEFIINTGSTRKLSSIDLNHSFSNSDINPSEFFNGMRINDEGYREISNVLLDKLNIQLQDSFSLTINEEGGVESCEYCETSSPSPTVNGFKIELTPDKGIYKGKITTPRFASIFIDGEMVSKSGKQNGVTLNLDASRHDRLVKTIKEKNQLYRSRLRPLNEAYIYLFRQHEMGHLAYEMDDLLKLVKEKEQEIKGLVDAYEYEVEIEMEKPYLPPKQYADDEIPAFIPSPDVTAEQAAFQVADGYEIYLFAKDPMIANPININWDTKGRAWVATSSTYPHIVPGREPNDKIIILEDTDGDGVADKHIVFADNLLVPHSVMPVKGGAFVTATTQLLFLADTDGDDRADETHIIYDGFGNADVHHTIHGLRWMPWGDLHFTQGIYINTFLETDDGIKRLNGSGIWSFDPVSEKIEVFSRGLINPWGEALDKWGQSFATDGAGSSGINYIFPGSAHQTAVGASTIIKGLNSGTPKYTGADLIYSSHFPEQWQGDIITNDFRANRTLRYKVRPENSAYKSEEIQTLLFSEHRSYRPVDSKIGPDGAIYIVDWYNPIIDHGEVDFHHPKRDKSHGRIWKLKRKNSELAPTPNIASLSTQEQLSLLKSKEQITRQLANRALVDKSISPEVVKNWTRNQNGAGEDAAQSRLEGLWLLAALQEYDEALLGRSLRSSIGMERAAAVRLISHYSKEQELFTELSNLIRDSNAQVRLEVLHALRALATAESVAIGMKVMDKDQDENLSYALNLLLEETEEVWLPTFSGDKSIFGNDAKKQAMALLTSENQQVIEPLKALLQSGELNDNTKNDIWLHLAKIGDGQTLSLVLEEALMNEDAKLLSTINATADDPSRVPTDVTLLKKLINHDSTDLKVQAIKLAGNWKMQELKDDLMGIIDIDDDEDVVLTVMRALINMEEFQTVETMAKSDKNIEKRAYATAAWIEHDPESAKENTIALLSEMEVGDALERLYSSFVRTENGPEILSKALSGKRIPEKSASAGLKVVQRAGLNLAELEETLREAGSIKSIGIELTDDEKDRLIENALADGDKSRGREVYRKQELMCGSCHVVDKEGGLSGPFLGKIGTFMTPRAILESVINPNAVIKQNYETVVVTKKDGEVVVGVQDQKLSSSIKIRQATGKVIEINDADIEKTEITSNSLMPTGLTSNLHEDELRDLLTYLMSLGVKN